MRAAGAGSREAAARSPASTASRAAVWSVRTVKRGLPGRWGLRGTWRGPGRPPQCGGGRPGFSAPDLDVLEDAERVRDQDRDGVVGAHEVGHDGLLVDAHEPH